MTSPDTLRAGDSAEWTESLPDFPAADGWAAKIRILFKAGTAEDLIGTASGTDWAFSASPTITASWPAGPATLVLYVERGTGGTAQRGTLRQRALSVLPNLLQAATFDGRSANRIALADCEAALSKYISDGKAHVQSYSIAGRTMQFRGTAEILDLIRYYKAEVAREDAALAILSGGTPGRVYTKI